MRLRHLALFTCLVSLATAKPALELHVALDGKAGNPGTIEAPLTFGAAIDKARDFLSKPNRPKTGGLEIIISAGRYPVTKAYRLGPEFQGSKDFPITIRAAKDAEVLFDGQAGIEDLSAFKPVTDESERARLAESARDQVLVQKVTSDALHHNLARRVSASINIDGQPWVASAYPNEGYAFLDPKPAIPEICPPGIPKKDQAYRVRAGKPPHQEPGKPRGWLGSMKEPRGAHARILDRSPARAGSWQQWQDEIARLTGRQEFMGFYEAVWKESRMPIKAVDAEKQTIHLPLVFSYGFGWLNDQPFRVFGLLCEVDQPGEWHYDPSSRKLYLIPPKPLDQIKSIGAPVAQGFLDLDRTRHVSIHGITVQNIAGGSVIRLINGSHNLVAGCTFRSSLARGIEVGGTQNRILGCDFIDLHGHINLSGGRRSVTEITPGHNLVENCHFYHKRFTQTKVRVAIGGVGNTFRRNLVHNSIGQAVTVSGNDHLLELNELFNIGYEEGDGAAIYSGADLAGYGNVYRHNFLHHLIRTPDKRLGRAGIMLDDHQAGGTIEGNVFFKSCTAAVQINCGAGNIVRNNVFLE
ncbi:MAG: right-handed parallel beta-helix repeat-containing protein, partial [Verrucomicrobiota bacterium]